MGFRTVVILFNDNAHEWEKDPELGKKIAAGMHHVHDKDYFSPSYLQYGRVVECVHADVQTLAFLDNYGFTPINHTSWSSGVPQDQAIIQSLKDTAEKYGYRLIRKPGSRC